MPLNADCAKPSHDASRGSAQPRERSLALDFLRGVAILLVIGRHAALPQDGRSLPGKLMTPWMRGGWMGVDLFFVIPVLKLRDRLVPSRSV